MSKSKLVSFIRTCDVYGVPSTLLSSSAVPPERRDPIKQLWNFVRGVHTKEKFIARQSLSYLKFITWQGALEFRAAK
jgi:hypothetical protein